MSLHPGLVAREAPERPALVTGRTVTTYAELEARSNRFAHLFRALGLAPGDVVAVLLENHPRFYEAVWGAHRAGLRYTCISTHLTAGEAGYILADCGARVLVTSAAQAEVAGAIARDVPHRLMLDGVAPGFASAERALASRPETPLPDESEGIDLLYSSGTTGRPKGVKLTLPGTKLGTAPKIYEIYRDVYEAGPGCVFLSTAPLYHLAPLRFNMVCHRFGGTAVIMERFDAAQALELIARHRVTHMQCVPTMFVRLLALPDAVRARADLSSLRAVIHGAAPCPDAIKLRMIEWFGPILHEYYAGTERNGYCTIDSREWLERRGSVGRAVIGTPHIVDDATGAELPPGETGTVWFGGGPAFEYLNDPAKTAAARDARGWSTIGDIGWLDADGYLHLTDRKAHMIITGGVNVYPQEVENLLAEHRAVADAAVFGVPDAVYGESVMAAVQPHAWPADAGALAAELAAFCRARLSHIKCPRRIEIVPDLPRQPNGKLYKQALRRRYADAP